MRFLAKQQMISAQGTVKAIKELDKQLAPTDELAENDADAYKKLMQGNQKKGS